MSQTSQPLPSDSGSIPAFKTTSSGSIPAIGTTSARLAAVRLKSANKYIFKALLSLASANLLIRIAGLVNQVVVTGRFGQGKEMDAYYVASAIPVLLAQLLASGLEASVIPAFARLRSTGNRDEASILFSTMLNILILGVAILTVLLLILHSQVIFFSAPGLDLIRQQLANNLTIYIFPVLLFMVINSFMESLLNAEGQFGWPAYAGILVPLTAAFLIIVAGKSLGVVMLCIGTLIGQVLQLGVIIIRARGSKLRYSFTIDWHNKELATIGMVAWPVLFSALISQASPLVDQMFASTLSQGTIAAMNNALKLTSVPTGVIFASVGRAALPYLARQAAAKDMKSFKETLRLYLWGVGIATLALSVFMIALAHPLVTLLFQRGRFTDSDSDKTAIILIGFVIGLTPMSFGFIVSRAFSALGKTRVLLYTTLFSIGANAVFDYLFMRLWGGFGIALSTSAVYLCTMFILLFTLRSMIGRLYLFTPPTELSQIVWKVGLGGYYTQWLEWKEENPYVFAFPYTVRRQVVRAILFLTTFIAGIVGVVMNDLYTMRIALGAVVVVFLLRYRYILLLIWVGIDAFIGSNLPFFNGNNLLSGLAAPTILLIFYLPVKQAFKYSKALIFLFIYVIWVLLSIGISPVSTNDFMTVWTLLVASAAVCVVTIFALTTRQKLLWLIDVTMIPSTFIAVYGIYGWMTKSNGIIDPTTGLFRAGSIWAAGPQTLSLFLSIVTPLALYRALTLPLFRRIGLLLLSIVFLAALGLTLSRGAIISMPISIVLMILFLPSKRLKVGLLGGVGAVGALVVLFASLGNFPIFSRFLNQDVTSLNGRTYLWQAILDHFDPTNLLGYGVKSSDVLLTNLRVGFGGNVIDTATHNIFLQTLYEHGIIGVIILSLVLLSLILTIFSRMRNATADYRMLLAACLAILFNVVIQSTETNDIWNQGVGIYFWISMTLPFAVCWLPTENVEPSNDSFKMEAVNIQAEGTEPAEQELLSHV